MNYINSLIKEIAKDMCIKEQKRTKFLLGVVIGIIIGTLFSAALFLELITLAPFSCKGG